MSGAAVALALVSKTFVVGSARRPVFSEFSLSLNPGEVVSILGPTGCGKTTLLNLIAGFLKPESGTITVNQKIVEGPDGTRAMIFQDDAVFPWYTVAENIGYGLATRNVSTSTLRDAVDLALNQFGLTDDRDKFPRDLSGGERKRVDLARGLAVLPEVLLMDEPFSSLDPATKTALWQHVSSVLLKQPTTTVLVTHDPEEAVWMGDRIVVLQGQPCSVTLDAKVSFLRPRAAELRYSSEFEALRNMLSRQLGA